jgi:hypothetical protein
MKVISSRRIDCFSLICALVVVFLPWLFFWQVNCEISDLVGLDGLMLDQVSQVSEGVLKPWGYISPEVVEQSRFRELLNLWGGAILAG